MSKTIIIKTTLFLLILSIISLGITFGLEYMGLPEKARASFSNNLQPESSLSNLDLIVAQGIASGDLGSIELARLIVADNVTKNPDADRLSLLIVLLDLFPQNTEELLRVIATDRTL